MDLQALIEAINKLLAAIGVDPLPETANEENLVPLLEGVALAIGQVGNHDEPDGDEGADNDQQDLGLEDGSTDATGGNTSVKMSNMLRGIINDAIAEHVSPLAQQMSLLSAKVGVEVESAEETEKANYMLFRNALAKSGVSEATLLGKDALAMQIGWKPALLEGLSPTITMQNVSRGGAGIVPPAHVSDVDPAGDKPSDKEIEERLKARGVDPKFMPK
jgi:hypothetical protein